MNYIGIDHHGQYSHMTLMDGNGHIIRSGKSANLGSELEAKLGEEIEKNRI